MIWDKKYSYFGVALIIGFIIGFVIGFSGSRENPAKEEINIISIDSLYWQYLTNRVAILEAELIERSARNLRLKKYQRAFEEQDSIWWELIK